MNSGALAERFARLPGPGPAGGLVLGRGTMRDYAALAEHHYKASRPATATRVLVLRDPRAGLAERLGGLGRRNASVQYDCDAVGGGHATGWAPGTRADPTGVVGGAHPTRDRGEVVGVLVESLPSLSCRLRDAAVGGRYGSIKSVRVRAVVLSEELRCISRVVVDPRWRGLGLAVRLVRAALATAETVYTEAIAAMGAVHPFFERAGMAAYRRGVHGHDARLAGALAAVGIELLDLGCVGGVLTHIEQLPQPRRGWVLNELRRWYRKTVGRSRVFNTDPRVQLKLARERLMGEPVYYVHDNRRPSA